MPDLDLPATPPGTRYAIDNDPARDPGLNPARTIRERVRRALGREPLSNWHGTQGFRAITECWNSAAFASRFGPSGSMILFGGGHNDYFGSDVHAFDLDSREWNRISDGFVTGAPGDYGAGAFYADSVYPDGSPLPPHTYDYLQYDPLGNDLLLLKGQLELGPAVRAVAIPHLFNLDELRWRRGPRHPTAILNSGGFTTWDAQRRTLWGHSGDDGGGNAFIGFMPDDVNADGTFGRWTERYDNKLPGVANGNCMQIDPVRDVIALAAHRPNRLFTLDPGDPGRPLEPVSESGDRPPFQAFAALEYAAGLDNLIYYSAHEGSAVYGARPPNGWSTSAGREAAWEWRLLSRGDGLDPIADAASATTGAVNRGHTFGRFRVATWAGIDVAILVRHVDSAVYGMKLGE